MISLEMYPLRVLHLVIIDLISWHLLNALWFRHPTAWSYYGSRSWCFWQERDPNIYDRLIVEFMISSSFEEYMVPDKTYYSWMTQQEPSYCLNQSWLCFLESKKPVKYSDHNYIGVLIELDYLPSFFLMTPYYWKFALVDPFLVSYDFSRNVSP